MSQHREGLEGPAMGEAAGAWIPRGGAPRLTRGTPERLRHAGRLAVFALAVVGALMGVGVSVIHARSDLLADAHAYYEAAGRLNAGLPLYPAGIDPNSNHIYLYPPLFAELLRPLALLSYEQFAVVWEAIVVVSFVALLRLLGLRPRTWLAIGILGIPIGFSLSVAQAHVPLTLLLAIGQPWSIALAANVKLFPALIAIWWIGRRDLQSLGAFVGWAGLLVAAQLLIDPKDSVAYFAHVGLDQLGQLQNISPWVVSPLLWAVVVAALAAAALRLAPTRWGWPLAVALGTVASPRLLSYMLMGLLAALREPRVVAAEREEEAAELERARTTDPAEAYVRSAR